MQHTSAVYGRDLVGSEAFLFLSSSHRNRIQIILGPDSIEDREFSPLLRKISGLKNVAMLLPALDELVHTKTDGTGNASDDPTRRLVLGSNLQTSCKRPSASRA